MRTRRRRTAAVSLIAASALVLAACGNGETQDAAADDPEPATGHDNGARAITSPFHEAGS